jgi:putative ABC transport system permease protein
MRSWEILRIAFDALLKNKMRSLLTMLGIIIGVTAVIAMVAIGQGATASVESQINSLGTNVLLIFPGTTTRGGVSAGAATNTTLTEEDAKAVKEQCPAVSLVSPILRIGGQVVYGNMNWGTVLQGGAVDFFSIRDWRVEEGDMFTEQDVRAATKVCLLGKTVIQQLFESENPIGQTIRIRNIPFKVLGTLKSKGQNIMGQDQDDIIILPYTTLQKRLMGSTRNWGFITSAVSKEKISEAQQQITELLRVRHKLQPEEDNDFTIRTQTDIAETASATTKIMTLLLGSIAGVSLIVGGIGIMNIMLVSVTERTREIGIRKAIGAKRRDILQQFLIEAIVMGIVGGIIGIGVGISVSNLIAKFAQWPVFVSPLSIILAVSFSAAVGIFFGYYPARKASSLNPIEALRYE